MLEEVVDLLTWKRLARSSLLLVGWWGVCMWWDEWAALVIPGLPLVWSATAYWRLHTPAPTEVEEDEAGQGEEEDDGDEKDDTEEAMRVRTLIIAQVVVATIHQVNGILAWINHRLDWTDSDVTTTTLSTILSLYPVWLLWHHLVPTYISSLLVGSMVILSGSRLGTLARGMVAKVWASWASSTHRAEASTAPYSVQTAVASQEEGGVVRIECRLVESQRYWVGLGWGTWFFPTDPPAWQDEQGIEATAPESYTIPAHTTTGSGEMTIEWQWTAPWGILRGPKADADGWRYGDTVWRGWQPAPGFTSYVRRRVWLRPAEVTSLSCDDPLA